MSPHLTLRFFQAALAFGAVAFAGPAPANGGPSVVDEVIASPESAWRRFLLEGAYPAAYVAYGKIIEFGYSLRGVDAAKCVGAGPALDEAVRLAPVSIAVHRMRLQCAEALGDEARAEQSLQAIGALSQLALRDGREPFSPKPIRVLGPMDIYALLASSGLEYRYEYYTLLSPRRHFPVVVAAWDDVLEVERHLAFDYIDVVDGLLRTDSYSGFPYQRHLLAESFVDAQQKAGELAAIDWLAIRAARWEDDPRIKATQLAAAAERGGVQALGAWISLCAIQPYDGCDDGLVDALLPHAERQQAAHMTLLALAYATGVGVEPDDVKAAAFLDAANRRWHGDGALVSFAQIWLALGREAPEFLRQRIDAGATAGNAGMLAMSAWLKLAAQGVPELDPAEVRALASPGTNGIGHGYALLANYHTQRGEAPVATAWTQSAADAGDPQAQATIGVRLHGAARDDAQRSAAMALVRQGAHGGSVLGMRYLGHLATREEAWADAEGWLLAAATEGDVDALLELASLYEWQRPGVRATQEQGIAVYTSMADEGDFPPARRALAEMALAGRGVDKDPAQAERWLLHDAERGDGESAGRLAMAYLLGEIGEPDEEKGGAWMQRAVDAGEKEIYTDWGSWYFYRNGNTLDSRRRALELWRAGVEADSRGARNNLAWAYCTAPEPELFDAQRGLEQAEAIMAWDDVPAGVLDTVAACHAAAGDHARAVEVQLQVIAMLTPREAEVDRKRDDNFFSRLDLYRAGERYIKAHRDAWPEQ
jgi:TPR repeat protein